MSWVKWIDKLRLLGSLCVVLGTLESVEQRELTVIQVEAVVLVFLFRSIVVVLRSTVLWCSLVVLVPFFG